MLISIALKKISPNDKPLTHSLIQTATRSCPFTGSHGNSQLHWQHQSCKVDSYQWAEWMWCLAAGPFQHNYPTWVFCPLYYNELLWGKRSNIGEIFKRKNAFVKNSQKNVIKCFHHSQKCFCLLNLLSVKWFQGQLSILIEREKREKEKKNQIIHTTPEGHMEF